MSEIGKPITLNIKYEPHKIAFCGAILEPSILDCRMKTEYNAHRTKPMIAAKVDTVLIEGKSVTIPELQKKKDTGESCVCVRACVHVCLLCMNVMYWR